MKAWRKFVDSLELTKDLEQNYFDMRKIFQREGWTQKDLENPPYYPQDLMLLHLEFKQLIQEVDRTISDYGFNVDGNELHYYIMDKLSRIDDITPLREPDGN